MLTKKSFWDIIEQSCNGRELDSRLITLTKEELISFQVWFDFYNMYAYREELWCAISLYPDSWSTDDGFNAFRNALIVRGYDTYNKVLSDPDALLTIGISFKESVEYIAINLLRVHFNVDIYALDLSEYEAKLPKLTMPTISHLSFIDYSNNNQYKPEVMKKMCPKLYAAYAT